MSRHPVNDETAFRIGATVFTLISILYYLLLWMI